MGALGLMQLFWLLLVVAIVAALGGYLGSAISRRNKRRARGIFLLGFFCGSVAGAILREKRDRTRVLAVIARHRGLRAPAAEIWRSTYRFASRTDLMAASSVRLGSSAPRRVTSARSR
jgi:outer membrane lipoprotein SlyB